MPLESTLFVLSPKHCIVVIGKSTRRAAPRRLDEDIANTGVPPHGNQYLPLEKVANDDQAMANPTAMTCRDIWESCL